MNDKQNNVNEITLVRTNDMPMIVQRRGSVTANEPSNLNISAGATVNAQQIYHDSSFGETSIGERDPHSTPFGVKHF